MKVHELFVKADLCKSNKEAKRLIKEGGAKINGVPIVDMELEVCYIDGKMFLMMDIDENHKWIHGGSFEDGQGKIIRIGKPMGGGH